MMVEVLLSVERVWLGTKGGSLTCSKTNDEDEAMVVPIWVGTVTPRFSNNVNNTYNQSIQH